MSERQADLALLRRYEPVLHFTRGEMFLPIRIDGYLQRCSLWRSRGRRTHQQLARVGEITAENIAELVPAASEATDYLRFVQQPMDFKGYRAWRHSTDRPSFSAIGRWARVGLGSRLLVAGFDISLWLRGVVPGGTVAVAERQYTEMRAERPGCSYYGRVVREGGYIACHYLFFYVMNDFRSTFFGVNDHEADWEQVIVYLTEDERAAEPTLSWVACAAHDLSGPDLRRRADDPQLRLVDGTHPVIYVGAGSHASYYSRGEYVFSMRPKTVRRALRMVDTARQVWRESLQQGIADPANDVWSEALAIPFIDYARGDGPRVGPDTDTPWDAVLLNGDEPWLNRYRGLWGLDTGDPFGGERAPAGPKYNRDGSIRTSWSDVIGFAGLDRVVPSGQHAAHLTARVHDLRADLDVAERRVQRLRDRLRAVELDHTAAREITSGAIIAERAAQTVATAQADLGEAIRNRDHLAESGRAVTDMLRRAAAGTPTDPRAHIQHSHDPDPGQATPRRLAEFWAASSGGLLLLVVAAVLVLPTPHKLAALLAAVVLFLATEAATRGRGLQFLIGYTIVAAVVAAVVLAVTYWQWSILLAIVLMALAIVRGNLQELRFLRAGLRRQRADDKRAVRAPK
jgi:hypothetical protein